MPFLLRGALIGGTVWFFWGFVWSLCKWLAIPLFFMFGFNAIYEEDTGTDKLKAQERAQHEAQRALVNFSTVAFTFEDTRNFAYPDASVTVTNNSERTVSNLRFVCTIPVTNSYTNDEGERTSTTREYTYTVKPTANKVVRPHKTVRLKLETPMVASPKQIGTMSVDCVKFFDISVSQS
jgi:hypothetical protein